MNIRKKLIATLVAGMTIASGASAATDTGTVGWIRVYSNQNYDEFSLTGDVKVCSQADPGWEHRVRLFKADTGYDAVSKVLLAAKLSGQQIEVSATNVNQRCILEWVRVL